MASARSMMRPHCSWLQKSSKDVGFIIWLCNQNFVASTRIWLYNQNVMTPVSKRESNRIKKRAVILRAFASLLAEAGYAGATMSKVAKRAKLLPGLLHYHFADKEEMATGLIVELQAVRDQRFALAIEKATDSRAKLHAFVAAHVRLDAEADADSARAWAAVSAEAQRSPALAKLYTRALQDSEASLRRLLLPVLEQKRRSLKAAPRMARTLLLAIEGVFHVAMAAPSLIPRGSSYVELVALADALIDAAAKE